MCLAIPGLHISATDITRAFFHEKPRRQKTDIDICCAVIRISESEKLKTQEYNVVVNENRKAENP